MSDPHRRSLEKGQFAPSIVQLEALAVAIEKPKLGTQRRELGEAVGLGPRAALQTVNRWFKDDGFRDWWDRELAMANQMMRGPVLAQLRDLVFSAEDERNKIGAAKVFLERATGDQVTDSVSTFVLNIIRDSVVDQRTIQVVRGEEGQLPQFDFGAGVAAGGGGPKQIKVVEEPEEELDPRRAPATFWFEGGWEVPQAPMPAGESETIVRPIAPSSTDRAGAESAASTGDDAGSGQAAGDVTPPARPPFPPPRPTGRMSVIRRPLKKLLTGGGDQREANRRISLQCQLCGEWIHQGQLYRRFEGEGVHQDCLPNGTLSIPSVQ